MSSTQSAVWPLPKFYFSVNFGNGLTAAFQEVTGLEVKASVIEYRAGNSKVFSTVKMPGLAKVGNVTMRKGLFTADKSLWAWFASTTMNTAARATIVISLLDEAGAPQYTWTLNNAFPTKMTGTDLKSEGNEVAVESVEVAFETMVISAP